MPYAQRVETTRPLAHASTCAFARPSATKGNRLGRSSGCTRRRREQLSKYGSWATPDSAIITSPPWPEARRAKQQKAREGLRERAERGRLAPTPIPGRPDDPDLVKARLKGRNQLGGQERKGQGNAIHGKESWREAAAGRWCVLSRVRGGLSGPPRGPSYDRETRPKPRKTAAHTGSRRHYRGLFFFSAFLRPLIRRRRFG